MSTQAQTGLVPLIDGQQSYAIVFSQAFQNAPAFFNPTVQMPSSSGEVFSVSADISTLTANGVTVWLSGVPSAASVGGFINWYAFGDAPPVPTISSGTGITVPQLFHRIGRRARGGDFTKLSMTEQTDLAEAVNTALQRLYNALPTYFKEQTQGFVLPSPLAISSVGVTQYGKTVTGITFTEAQFGQTVVLDGDGSWNQIVGTDELLNPYMGATGTVGGTIYGNAFHSTTFPLDRIIGDPRFADQTRSPYFNYNITRVNEPTSAYWFYAQQTGFPLTWWTQVFGNSQGNKPIMVLRFAPAPNTAIGINVRIGFWPKRITLLDYDNATELCVPDQFIESALIPMCLQAFMSSPAWLTKGDETMIEARGDKGEAFARGQPGQIGSPNNQIFTPFGW